MFQPRGFPTARPSALGAVRKIQDCDGSYPSGLTPTVRVELASYEPAEPDVPVLDAHGASRTRTGDLLGAIDGTSLREADSVLLSRASCARVS
jgi:hypothetical protein